MIEILKNQNPFTRNNKSQKEATQEILASIPLYGSTIEEVDAIAKERSERLYNERQQRISTFNPFKVKAINSSNEPLSSTEKYFFKQMHGQNVNNPTVNAYWIYEYSIDFEKIMTKLIINNYLQLSDLFSDIDCLTINQLKQILNKNSLKLTGKKAELIKRIKDNISLEVLTSELGTKNTRYVLTSKGKEATFNLPKSMSKNLELEDLCMKYIFEFHFDTAYKLICENEIQKIIPRGLNIDWNIELSNGLSSFKQELFNNFMNSPIAIPDELSSYLKEAKACTILGILAGSGAQGIADLFVRITNIKNIQRSIIISTLQNMQFMLLDAIQKHSFDMLQY